MTEKRNILLLGRTGNGKSTLANVLLNRNGEFEEVFKESSESTSETRDLQIELLEMNVDNEGREKIDYRIVDTVGVGDTKLDPQGVLWKLARIAHELRDGLNQVLFVTRGRFTKEEAEAYDLLSSIIFDSEVVKYTTIVRAGFPSFMDEKKCEADREKLKKENPKIAHIFKEVRKIIYVDNPPMEGFYLEMAKQVRQESRKRLLTYLGTCLDTYRPSNLATLNERIGDYMTNEEKLIKEMKELEEKRKEEAEKFLKEIERIEKERDEKLKQMEEKNKKDIEDAKEKSRKELQETTSRMQSEHKKDMDDLKRANKEEIKDLKDTHRQESQRIIDDNKRTIDSIQEQNRRDREASEKQINELREKRTSSASEISSALANLNLGNKSSDSGDWKLKIKQLESADLRAQQAHEARMAELKTQQKENQTKATSQTQSYVEERRPGVTAGLAGAGATIGSAFGPVGTLVGGAGGWLLGKLLN